MPEHDLEAAYATFPKLAERRRQPGGLLSGGQQMLAITRALVSNPRVLLLDDPAEGLAPVIVHEVGETLLPLKAQGHSILLVEQNTLALRVADDAAILNTGRIIYHGSAEDVHGKSDLLHQNPGVLKREYAMPLLERIGLRIEHRKQAHGRALLLHSRLTDRTVFDGVAPALAAARGVTRINLRGVGASYSPDRRIHMGMTEYSRSRTDTRHVRTHLDLPFPDRRASGFCKCRDARRSRHWRVQKECWTSRFAPLAKKRKWCDRGKSNRTLGYTLHELLSPNA